MTEEKQENEKLKNKLQKILSKEDKYSNSLIKEVIEEAFEQENIKNWFSDLLTYGCVSGMVGKLIYHIDTRNFYDEHYDEIEYLRFELEESFGEPLKPDGDLKNWFAWFAFEETAYKIHAQLGLEI